MQTVCSTFLLIPILFTLKTEKSACPLARLTPWGPSARCLRSTGRSAAMRAPWWPLGRASSARNSAFSATSANRHDDSRLSVSANRRRVSDHWKRGVFGSVQFLLRHVPVFGDNRSFDCFLLFGSWNEALTRAMALSGARTSSRRTLARCRLPASWYASRLTRSTSDHFRTGDELRLDKLGCVVVD